MAFPQTPLPVTVLLAPGANPADPTGWDFTNVNADVREASGVEIQVGRQDESDRVGPTQITATFDNRAGHYSPRNPLGQYFGRLAKGTPAQVRVNRITDTFTRTVAAGGLGTEPSSGLSWTPLANGSTWSANGSAAQCSITTVNQSTTIVVPGASGDDVSVSTVASVSAVMTGAAWVHGIVLRATSADNCYRMHTEFGVGGTVGVKIVKRLNGANNDLTPVVPSGLTYSAGTKIRARAQAIGALLRIKVWLDGTNEPAAWTVQVNDSSLTGQQTGLFQWRVSGNTNAGTLTATIDDYVMDVIRGTTPVPDWPTRWDQTGTNATAPVTGAGILRRLSQGQSALRSPMYKQISSYTRLIGYWPLEDGTETTRPANVLAGGAPASATEGINFGSDGPAGSAGAATITTAGSDSKISGAFKSASSSAGWQISWTAKLAALPGGLSQMIAWFTTAGHSWAINLNSGVYNIKVVDADGGVLEDSNISFVGFDPPDDWVTFRMKATASGGTVTGEFAWFGQGARNVWGTTVTFPGSVGALKSWTANGNGNMVNAGICHVFGVTTGLDDLQSFSALRSFDGYVGETAGARAERLCDEQGVPFALIGAAADTAAMGKQTVATLLDLLRECEEADQGVLLERGAGLGYLTRSFRYNQPVVMALDFASGHVAAPPEPVDDDQRLRNKITLKRAGGSEASVQDDSSIALSGTYEDELTVNLADDSVLTDHAAWRLHLGTADEVRWPRITLKLHRNPSLIGDWCKVRVGSRITIANPPTPASGKTLDLIVEGWTETLSTYAWTVELACSPASLWDVGVYDDAGTRRDSTSTTLGVARDAVQTSWTFSTANTAETWSTAAGDYPLDVNCGGEQVRVTAMGAVSGSGPYLQTATVQRSLNGIVKPQAAGTQISLWRPVYRGL